MLSEFAGSAQSLSGAIRVNPWNTEELARAIHEALTLTRVERELRWAKLHRYVTTNTASYWARSFVSEFRDVCEHPPLLSKLPKLNAASVLSAYSRAKNRFVAARKSTTGTPCPAKTSNLSISIKSKSIRLIFGRIDCSRRVLYGHQNELHRNRRIRAH